MTRLHEASVSCSACGSTIESTFQFCPHCGSPVGSGATGSHLERRVITVLFCDLVDFSELAYRLDAEDVQRLLGIYLELVRDCLESFGAVVEKFIGDAVVAVFGYDEAHDDDTDRALLASLGVLESLAEHNRAAVTPLHVHLGIHVGEAVTDLAANPASGDGFLAGHVVNLAQRLQSLAPPDTVVVSREVVDRAQRNFSFAQRPPGPAKGSPGLLENWQLRGPRRAAPPDVIPLVGRDDEVAVLTNLLHEVAGQARSQVVTISGEAGAGKSRLLGEFEARSKAQPFDVIWRKGRCLPYGTGITFSALAEVLKQSTGVFDSDRPDVAREKVRSALAGEPDGEWLTQRLLPLLGVETSSVDREELFAAWTSTLVALSRDVATVMVIEDVHWADQALLAFVEGIARVELPGRLLLVLTTRPSLVEDQPGWPGPTARQLVLGPLAATETEQIVAAELGEASLALSTSLRHSLLERAAGNPLFAREFARLVRDSRRLGGDDPTAVDSLPVPTTIHALLAARLDTLSLFERAVVQSAAVIGKVFWAGAVAALGDLDDEDTRRTLDTLSSHGIVRRRRVSMLASESEFMFSHVLLRDVAYERAPRAWRRDAHLRAVEWIESVAGSRLDEVAEVLVHHATAALDFAELTGAPEVGARASSLARQYARAAARRAMALDAHRALAMLDIARRLTPPGDPDEGDTLLAWSVAAFAVDRVAEATEVRRQVVHMLRGTDDRRLLATALMELGDGCYQLGDLDGALAADREAADMGRTFPPVADEGDPVANLALTLAAVADVEGLSVADEAERRAAHAGLPIPLPALRARAMLRLQLGDPAGLADHDEAVRRLMSGYRPNSSIASALSVRADGVWAVAGADAAVVAYSEAVDFASTRGLLNIAQWSRVNRLTPMLESGAVADVLAQGLSSWPALADSRIGLNALGVLVGVAAELEQLVVLRDCHQAAQDGAEAALGQADTDPEQVAYGVLPALRTAYLLGDHARATSLLKRFVDVSEARQTSSYGHHLLSYVRLALVCGAGDIASVLATPDRVDRTLRGVAQRTATAWLALDAGQLTTAVTEFSAVADRWWAVGNRLEHSYCLVGIATALEAGEDPVAPPARNEAELARSALGLPWPCIAPAARGPDVDRGPGASDDRGGATSSA